MRYGTVPPAARSQSAAPAGQPAGGSLPARPTLPAPGAAAGRLAAVRRRRGHGGCARHSRSRGSCRGRGRQTRRQGLRADGATAAHPADRVVAPARPAGSPAAGTSQVAGDGAGASQVALAGTRAGVSGQARRPRPESAPFRQIILPDLLIVAPKGLTAAADHQAPQDHRRAEHDHLRRRRDHRGRPVGQRDRRQPGYLQVLGAAADGLGPGVLDGAGWRRVRRRRPAPRKSLGAASRAATTSWSAPSAQVVRFGMAARLGLSGVDLLVNQATSAPPRPGPPGGRPDQRARREHGGL